MTVELIQLSRDYKAEPGAQGPAAVACVQTGCGLGIVPRLDFEMENDIKLDMVLKKKLVR